MRFSRLFGILLSSIFIVMAFMPAGYASSEDIPRILMVGDSWPGFMQVFRSFDVALDDYGDLAQYGQVGYRTTEVGIRVDDYLVSDYMNAIAEELDAYPTIDIVHLSLGGNDLLMGSDRWRPDMTPAEQDALFQRIIDDIETVVDYILAIRPDILIGLCGYTFGHHEVDGATVQQINTFFAEFEAERLQFCQSKDRVFFIHNLGLAQYHFGISEADPAIEPYSVPYPGGYPDYTPLPGGNIDYFAPLSALMDNDIHLNMEGYTILAKRCIDEFYGDWLGRPRVLEVLPVSQSGSECHFQVTFSEAVSGVDRNDFQLSVTPAKATQIITVTGSGSVYMVTADTGGASGEAVLTVLDDDSITDGDGTPLGGTGVDNGVFSANGELAMADPPCPEPEDFTGAMNSLDRVSAPYHWMLGTFSFEPDVCDANGGSINVNPPSINGNGIPDSCELGLIQACLENPDLNLYATGGVVSRTVTQAWEANYQQMLSDMGGAESLVLESMPGISSLMGGFMTLGDSGSTLTPVILITALSMFIQFPDGVTTPVVSDYTTLPEWFGPDGDADGDGFTNSEEYAYFAPIGGQELYIAAALDPVISPESSCGNSEGGVFDEGTAFCLSLPFDTDMNAGYQWYRNGEALEDDGHLSGSQWAVLSFRALEVSDTGSYTCEYTPAGRKAIFGPVDIVVEEVEMPVTGIYGVILLLLGFGIFGARQVYRGMSRKA